MQPAPPLCLPTAHVQDIKANLNIGRPGGCTLREWVTTFERRNLQLSVAAKGPSLTACFASLVAQARSAGVGAAGSSLNGAGGAAFEPTLVYALTTKEVDEVWAHLQQQGVRVARWAPAYGPDSG